MGGAFVAGATGYTGREVVRALRARGIGTVAHVRPDSARLESWRATFVALGAEVDVSPWTRGAMTDTLARHRPDVVFALLGTTRARGARAARSGGRETYESVDYGLTHLLLEATLAAAIRPRFVYLSSVGVAAGSRAPYLTWRWKLESELHASGLPYVIARPSFITGPDRAEPRPLERVGALLADAALTLAGALGARRLRERYRSTTAGVLAEALVRAGLDGGAPSVVLESEALWTTASPPAGAPAGPPRHRP